MTPLVAWNEALPFGLDALHETPISAQGKLGSDTRIRRIAQESGDPKKYNEAIQEMLQYAKCKGVVSPKAVEK